MPRTRSGVEIATAISGGGAPMGGTYPLPKPSRSARRLRPPLKGEVGRATRSSRRQLKARSLVSAPAWRAGWVKASLCFVPGVNRGVAGARRVPYRVVRKWGALEAPAATSLSPLIRLLRATRLPAVTGGLRRLGKQRSQAPPLSPFTTPRARDPGAAWAAGRSADGPDRGVPATGLRSRRRAPLPAPR